MIARFIRRIGAILAVTLVTWVALSLLIYLAVPRTIDTIYQNSARRLMHVDCGRAVADELVYTLQPGECRFTNPEFDTQLTIDADGFRNAPEHRGTGSTKVAVLGDSHAIGWGVAQGDKLASLLARDPRFQVRDLAMPSYGTARELIALQRYASDADVIVIQYCFNDRAENTEFLRAPAQFSQSASSRSDAFNAEAAKLKTSESARASALSMLRAGLTALSATWRLMRLPPRSPRQPPASETEFEARAFAGVLAHFKDQFAGKTVVVFESYPRSARTSFAPTFRAALGEAGLGGVIVLDLVDTIGPSDYFHIDDHLNARGHARIAARLLAELNRPGRLPARP